MPNESPQQAKARKLHEGRDRCREAAHRLRRWIAQGRYSGLADREADDLLHVAAILDSAALELSELPRGTRSDVLHLVRRLLDDDPHKLGPTPPLSAGDGH